MTRTVSIAAGSTYTEKIRAKVFVCIKTGSNDITVSADSGHAEPIFSGVGFGSSTADFFSRLEFSNPTSAAVTITFYAGDSDYRAFSSQERELQFMGGDIGVGSGGGTQLFPSIWPSSFFNDVNPGARRIFIRFQNMSATLPLLVQIFRNALGSWQTIASIPALGDLTIEGRYDMRLLNNGASTVTGFYFEKYEL